MLRSITSFQLSCGKGRNVSGFAMAVNLRMRSAEERRGSRFGQRDTGL
jgi:hypothetical protein